MRRTLLVLLVFAAAGAARATSVVAPTFAELVDEAQSIVRAKVTSTECRWAAAPNGRVIKTHVTFAVLKTLKGEANATLTLEFLGGELDGQGMRVEGMPRFAVGDTEIVFVAGNQIRFCPLVGMAHGRYRVLTEPSTGREYVARNDRVPLENEHEVQLPQGAAAGPLRVKQVSAALTPNSFEAKISAELFRRASLP